MIDVRCDKCEKPFQVEDSRAGQKVACPACGDVTFAARPRVDPDGAQLTPAVDRAAQAGKPPSSGPEQFVRLVRPAMLRARPLTFLLLAALLAGGLVMAVVWGTQRFIGLAVAGVVAALAASGVLVFWKLTTLESGLRITTKRTVEQVGLFSKATTEILHKDIRNFTVTQSFWQRLWGVGTIGISSAAEDETEIVMKDVPKPKDVHALIDLYRPM